MEEPTDIWATFPYIHIHIYLHKLAHIVCLCVCVYLRASDNSAMTLNLKI